jgi:cytoskeletal protein RodZ
MKVKISREAKILLGLMFLAAAILVWINVFTQQQGFGLFGNQSTLPATSGEYSSSADVATTPANGTVDANATADATATDTALAVPSLDASTITPEGSAAPIDIATSGEVVAVDPLTPENSGTDTSVSVTAVQPLPVLLMRQCYQLSPKQAVKLQPVI